MNSGLKISEDGEDISSLDKLVVDSKYPTWKCDLRSNPKHYGVLKCTFNLGVGEVKTLFSIKHGYSYIPSFLVAWNYPAGTDASGNISGDNQTTGLGSIEIFTNSIPFDVILVRALVDNTNFKIVVGNEFTANAYSNLYAELRYYIFADDFPSFQPGVSL